jgi:hypothetical protein
MPLQIKIINFVFLFIFCAYAQVYKPAGYLLNTADEGSANRQLGNAMVDMNSQDSLLFAGSGFGLNRTSDGGYSWTAFTSRDYSGKGGVSAMSFMDDSTFWIAAAYDTSIRDLGRLDAGGGLSYTRDYGRTWTHVRQPIDRRDETEYSPTTTVVQNVTFDIAFYDSTAWIASWGGGLRKSTDMGETWTVVTTDGRPFDANSGTNPGWRNHIAFSITKAKDELWVGTAEGISKSTDNGETWRRFTHQNQDLPISGNFVVALAYQSYTNTLWAATIETDIDTSEFRAVSRSENGGETWETTLAGTFCHNFAFDDSVVYAATDLGMYVSNDQGENWYLLPPIKDYVTGQEVLGTEYFSAAVSIEGLLRRLWVGNTDGLASTIDNGNTWKVHRSFKSTRRSDTPEAYAYPSPFSPSRQGYVRFQYDIEQGGEVIIDIYDFALDHVATIREYETDPIAETYDRNAKWDGKNNAGVPVASGVYFFRANIVGNVTWGKLVLIN